MYESSEIDAFCPYNVTYDSPETVTTYKLSMPDVNNI